MKKILALVWLTVVLAAVGHVGLGLTRGLPLQSDIMALLPREDSDPAVLMAKDRMAKLLAGRVVVMTGSPSRQVARDRAEALRRTLLEQGLIQNRSDIPAPDAIKKMGAAYFPHRAGLLADSDREKLEQGQGAALESRALSQIFGFGGAVDSRLLAADPFLLFPSFLGTLPFPANRLSLDDGMLSVVEDGVTWVMLSLTLAGEPYALDFQKRFLQAMDSWQADLPAEVKTLRLGALFFAQAGAASAMGETSRIGALSLAGTVLLVVLVFRSAAPLLLSLAALGAGLAAALSVCLILFGQIHVAAQLFGASLMGVAVDYALLYFGQIFTPRTDPARRLAHVLPAMSLGAVTTIVAYATLALSPFPGLKQVAVFSAVGLAGSFLSVALWFPLLERTPSRRLDSRVASAAALLAQSRARWMILPVLLIAALWGLTRLEADDDVRRQQGLNPALAAQQAEIQRLAGFRQGSQFFVVQGDDEQQVLEREEALGVRLNGRIGWQAAARFVPSAKRQAENAELAQRALLGPRLAAYRSQLGMADPQAAALPAQPLTLAKAQDSGALPLLDTLVVNPRLHVVSLDGALNPAALRAATEGLGGVVAVDPTGDISQLLETYRHRALALLALSCGLMLPILGWRYGWRGSLRVMAPAVAAIALTPPLLALAGIGFSFFGAMALVLALSIGVDYAVFCAEDRQRDPATLVSISLAMVTTLLSFGLLGLSHMAAVRAFGLTMSAAVFLAFLLAPAAARR